jgi:hypothetical protein
MSDQLHAPAALPPGKEPPVTHWTGGWVNPRTGLDDVDMRNFLIIPGLEIRPLGRPDRSQSLCRLRYPGSWGTLYRILYRIFYVLNVLIFPTKYTVKRTMLNRIIVPRVQFLFEHVDNFTKHMVYSDRTLYHLSDLNFSKFLSFENPSHSAFMITSHSYFMLH